LKVKEKRENNEPLTMYIKNGCNSSNIKHYSSVEHYRKLENMCFAIGNFSYTHHELENPMPWSEDFSIFAKYFHAAFFGLRSGENCSELHHAEYDFPDKILETSVNLLK